MTHIKSDTLYLRVWVWGMDLTTPSLKNIFFWEASKKEEAKVHQGL